MEKRCRTDIMADVLKTVKATEEKEDMPYGAKKKHIMEKAGLNFSQLRRYLKDLTDLGFLREENGFYRTTENGSKFIEKHQEIQELLK